jgi:hypothetical protein
MTGAAPVGNYSVAGQGTPVNSLARLVHHAGIGRKSQAARHSGCVSHDGSFLDLVPAIGLIVGSGSEPAARALSIDESVTTVG